MPVISHAAAPRFDDGGTHVIGLASPSRGATETSAWRLRLDAGASSPPHSVDREHIFVALAGTATATFAGDEIEEVAAGGALVVPADTEFVLTNPGPEPFEAVVLLPVGGRATVGGERFIPPWAV
jgi:mannose-6-phosphate isomerase-like protein (cupin superfamily)